MFSNEPRCVYGRTQLVEVVCQLRFPAILKIDKQEPFELQDVIRSDYPNFSVNDDKLPPRMVNGRLTEQGTVKNYQFISMDGGWKVNLTRDFISLSSHRYTRWEDFAQRLDRILAEFIPLYKPACFNRIGLRFINAFNQKALGMDVTPWKELITPGFLGIMGDDDAREDAFVKNEQNVTANLPGGSRCNIKCGKGVLRKVNNQTRATVEEPVYMLDLDVYMEGSTQLSHVAPALNVVHGNADSLFRAAITDTLHNAMEPQPV